MGIVNVLIGFFFSVGHRWCHHRGWGLEAVTDAENFEAEGLL